MKRQLRTISIAFFLVGLGTLSTSSLASERQTRQANWDILKGLAPGDEIKIAVKNGKSETGTLRGVTEDGIVLRLTAENRLFERHDISAVFAKHEGHRPRNALIGALVGQVLGWLSAPWPMHAIATIGFCQTLERPCCRPWARLWELVSAPCSLLVTGERSTLRTSGTVSTLLLAGMTTNK